MPSLQSFTVRHFISRQELIEAMLASAHVPVLMNWRLYTHFRGRAVVDGNYQYGWRRKTESIAAPGYLLCDPRQDKVGGWLGVG